MEVVKRAQTVVKINLTEGEAWRLRTEIDDNDGPLTEVMGRLYDALTSLDLKKHDE